MNSIVAKALDFTVIKTAVAAQFAEMQKHPLYRTAVEKDEMWETYIRSFPVGTNNIFRQRTDHDCNCCKHFIRSVGNVVAISDGSLVSIWDGDIQDEAYARVANSMSELVKSKPVENVFLHPEPVAGVDKNFNQTPEGVVTWKHFYVRIPPAYVAAKDAIPTRLGEIRSTYDVSLRGLNEIDLESIATVLELIGQNSLYRGEEHRHAVEQFQKLKRQFVLTNPATRELFVWESLSLPGMRIRNTVIGTLLVDLAQGVDLDQAVKSFEQKVAPTNYKRPSALVTKAMIEKAKETLDGLGLTSALERRFATLDDISINNVLFADRSIRKKLGAVNVFEELIEKAASGPTKKLDRIEEIPVATFIAEVLPRAEQIEVLFENRHQNNLVSLIAPVDPHAERLFKWANRFSWSYQGEVADSIKERVKRAGGNVTGDLCCRLAWYNHDDLDFHMKEPGGYEIYFPNKTQRSPSGGILDVDMNAGHGATRTPVENIYYATKRGIRSGTYTLQVHNYCKRESSNEGFEVEIDWLGDVRNFAYPKPVRNGETITIAQLVFPTGKEEYSRDNVQIVEKLPSSKAVRHLWGLDTCQYQKVKAITLSPNHWDEREVGNRHWFFLLEGCVNDGTARGFFNEFLLEDVTKHRKVLEIVGGKTKVEQSENQLSGLGFSSTKSDTLVCRVKGSFSREVKILF